MKTLNTCACVALALLAPLQAEVGQTSANTLPEPVFSVDFRPEAILAVLEKVAANQKPDSGAIPGPVFSAGWQAFSNIAPESKTRFADSGTKFWDASDYGEGFLPCDKSNFKEKFSGPAGARKLAGLALHIESLPAGTRDKPKLIDVLVEGVVTARAQRIANGLWAKDFVDSKKTDAADLESTSFLAFATARGIREGYRMLWLDGPRVVLIRAWINMVRCIGPDGNLRALASGPEATRPCSETAGAFLLAGSEIFRLAKAMQEPMPFVTTAEYQNDLKAQAKAIADQPPVTRAATLETMRKVCTWQLGNLFKGTAGDAQAPDRSWFRGAFLSGVIVAARETKDEFYWELARKISEENQWQPGPNVLHDGNDLAVTQAYLALYLRDHKNAEWIQPTRAAMDTLAAKAHSGRKEWSWADALFMAPAAWAQMSLATGVPEYRERMNLLWWDSIDLLLDKEEQLVYRDGNFMLQPDGFQIRERNGKKIFWGRGNGWVIGGLCNVLEALPKDYPERYKYEELLKNLCTSLAAIQGADGLWRASLLDPDSYPLGETSGSTFFCYGVAWGINHGVLDREKFAPVAKKAWHALMACVEPDGKLGYVQLPAESPRSPTYRSKNVEYAAGAFLAAGAEMLEILEK